MKEAVQLAQSRGSHLSILSDANDVFIREILIVHALLATAHIHARAMGYCRHLREL